MLSSSVFDPSWVQTGTHGKTHRGSTPRHYRAAEWRHKEIELAAHELLQYLDENTA
jgi:hypothetical protein